MPERSINQRRQAELQSHPKHAHDAAAVRHDKEPHLTSREISQREQDRERVEERRRHATERLAHDRQPEHQEIEVLAYQLWQQRGCPSGSAEEDWFRAETELDHRR